MKTKCRIITLLSLLIVTVLFIYHKNEYEGFEGVVDDAKEAAKESAAAKARDIKITACVDSSKIVVKECSKNQEYKKFRQACDEARGVMLNKCIDDEHQKDVPCKKSKKGEKSKDEGDEGDEDEGGEDE